VGQILIGTRKRQNVENAPSPAFHFTFVRLHAEVLTWMDGWTRVVTMQSSFGMELELTAAEEMSTRVRSLEKSPAPSNITAMQSRQECSCNDRVNDQASTTKRGSFFCGASDRRRFTDERDCIPMAASELGWSFTFNISKWNNAPGTRLLSCSLQSMIYMIAFRGQQTQFAVRLQTQCSIPPSVSSAHWLTYLLPSHPLIIPNPRAIFIRTRRTSFPLLRKPLSPQ
jgi:hypothetical protein